MGIFFASKVEKTLSKAMKKSMKVELRYADGNLNHDSKIVRVDPEKFLIQGFTDHLREDIMEIRVPELNICFESKVIHISQDIRGNLIYHCPHPTDFKPCVKREERFFVYPRMKILLAWETPEGIRKLELHVWDVTKDNLEVVNHSEEELPEGLEFITTKIVFKGKEMELDLIVKYLSVKQYGKQILHIVGCEFKEKPENFNDFLEYSKKLDSL
jgi:hypothetical protein